jgi:hypothetical protein
MKAVRRFATIENHGSCELISSIQSNLTEDDQCTRAFRGFFASKIKTIEAFEKHCNLSFDFPRYSFISANVQTRYNKTIVYSSIFNRTNINDFKETSEKPQYYCFNGSITCNGILTTLNQSFCLSPIDILIQYNQWPFRYIACLSSFANPQPSYQTTSHHLWQCQSNHRLISEWRIHDGHIDCFNGEDMSRKL